MSLEAHLLCIHFCEHRQGKTAYLGLNPEPSSARGESMLLVLVCLTACAAQVVSTACAVAPLSPRHSEVMTQVRIPFDGILGDCRWSQESLGEGKVGRWDRQQPLPLDTDLHVGPCTPTQRPLTQRQLNSRYTGKDTHRLPCALSTGDGDEGPHTEPPGAA